MDAEEPPEKEQPQMNADTRRSEVKARLALVSHQRSSALICGYVFSRRCVLGVLCVRFVQGFRHTRASHV